MHASRIVCGTSCALLLFLQGSLPLYAQQSREPIPLVIRAGDVLELGADTAVQNPEFSWYMTQNQQFIEAQRGRVFQKRLVSPGTYNLDASIKNEEGTQSEFLTFAVTVLEQPQDLSTAPTSSGSIVPRIITEPAMNADGTVSLPSQGGVLMIDASKSSGQIATYAMDMDGSNDSDGNGNASDDTDNASTFGLQDGTPFRYFVRPGTTQRTIMIHLTGNDAKAMAAQFAVRFDGRAVVGTQGVGALIEIDVHQNGLAADFMATLPRGMETKPVLFQWDFGDGAKSLLTHPVHTYTKAGTYTVMLTVMDLATGQVLFSGQRALTAAENNTASRSSAVSSAPATDGGVSIPWKAISILGILILLAIVAFVLLTWFKNKMTGTIQKKLESVEKQLFEEKKAATNGSTPPLQLKKPVTITQDPKPQDSKQVEQSIVEREKVKTEFTKSEPRVAVSASGPVPSWLKNTPVQKQGAQEEAVQPVFPQKSAQSPAPQPVPIVPPQKGTQPPPASKPLPTAPVPKPAPQPKPLMPTASPVPKPVQPSLQKKEQVPETPKPAPVSPPEKTPVVEQPQPPLQEPEKPIAFIRAESLEKKNEPPVQP